MCFGPCIFLITEEQNPPRCHLLLYYAYVRLNMFRAPLCPSSGAVTASGPDTHPSCLYLTSNQQQLENQTACLVTNAIVVNS